MNVQKSISAARGMELQQRSTPDSQHHLRRAISPASRSQSTSTPEAEVEVRSRRGQLVLLLLEAAVAIRVPAAIAAGDTISNRGLRGLRAA